MSTGKTGLNRTVRAVGIALVFCLVSAPAAGSRPRGGEERSGAEQPRANAAGRERSRKETQPVPRHPVLPTFLSASGGEFEIYRVTSLGTDPAVPGTLPHALTTATPAGNGAPRTRIVVFAVSGTVAMPPQGDRIVSGKVPAVSTIREMISTRTSKDSPLPGRARGNLVVAGQIAPDPGDGSGRGIELEGGIHVRGPNTWLEHLRIRRVRGRGADNERAGQGHCLNIYSSVTHCDEPGFVNTGGAVDPRDPVHYMRNVIVRNCSVAFGQDTMTNIASPSRDNEEIVMSDRVVIQDCLYAQPLSYTIAGRKGTYCGTKSHNYSMNINDFTKNVFVYGTIFAAGQWRNPWLRHTYALLANNVWFNFGNGTSGAKNRHFPCELVSPQSRFTNMPARLRECRADVIKNLADFGDRTGDVIDEKEKRYFAWCNNRYVDGEHSRTRSDPRRRLYAADNWYTCYYTNTKDDPAPGWDDSNRDHLQRNIVFKERAAVLATEDGPANFVAEEKPFYPAPPVLFDPEHEVRNRCLHHAGAWPDHRDGVDAHIIAGIADRTLQATGTSDETHPTVSDSRGDIDWPHDGRGAIVPDTDAIATVLSGPLHRGDGGVGDRLLASDPHCPGLTVLEAWLHRKSVAAGADGRTIHLAGWWLAAGRRGL